MREDVIGAWLQQQLQRLGDAAAAHLSRVVPQALDSFEHVLVLMHVPPFHAACWHDGRPSDDDWAPHFVCQAAGDVLASAMRQRPEKRMTVLCGHTHSPGEAQILDNLRVLTGGAVYGEPQLQQVLELH
jgi:3',5'-cyclic AMP phosphodiesterase CpdA